MTVINSEDRFNNRKLVRLIGMIEAHHKDVLENPHKYLELAAKKIEKQEKLIRKLEDNAWVCLSYPTKISEYNPLETMVITKEDYDCLQSIRKILAEER